jgi:hypothetical protein
VTEYATEEEIHNAFLAFLHCVIHADKLNAVIHWHKFADLHARRHPDVVAEMEKKLA